MKDQQEYQGSSTRYGAAANCSVFPGRPTPSVDLRRLVDVLLATETMRRPALSRQTGLPRQKVSDLMSGLETLGLVQVDGRFSGHPGRSSLTYTVTTDAATALAFDIGKAEVGAALVNLRGLVLSEITESCAAISPNALTSQLERLATELCQRSGIARHTIRNAALTVNLGEDASPELVALLAQRLCCPARLETGARRALTGARPELARAVRAAWQDMLHLLFGPSADRPATQLGERANT